MAGKLSVKITKRALLDISEIAECYGEVSLELELSSLDAAEGAFDRLAEMPQLGTLRQSDDSRLSRVRMWPIAEFPNILVFYQAQRAEVQVVRLLHSARNISEMLSPLA